MEIRPPTEEHIRRAADDLGLTVDDADVREFAELAAGAVSILRPLDAVPDSRRRLHTSGRRGACRARTRIRSTAGT